MTDTKHTPKDTNSPDSISTEKDVYQHTDSVEVSYLTDIAIEVWNQNCDKSAPEAMRAVVTALQAHTSQQVENWHKESFDRGLELGQQQVEEAVSEVKDRAYKFVAEYKEKYAGCGMADSMLALDELLQALTPNHQD